MSGETTSILDPSILAWWTRAVRETSHWSQEALAAASGLTVRTIQRIEAGQSSNVTTRRALARGLGYDNTEIFFDPEFAKTIAGFWRDIEQIGKEALAEQFPDKVRLQVAPVRSGAELCRLAEAPNAHNYHCDDDIAGKAKEVAASLFDYLTDYADVEELHSNVDKLTVQREVDSLLRDLEKLGGIIHSAMRTTSIVRKGWSDQTPMQLDVLYLVVHAADKVIDEILVTKKVRVGF